MVVKFLNLGPPMGDVILTLPKVPVQPGNGIVQTARMLDEVDALINWCVINQQS